MSKTVDEYLLRIPAHSSVPREAISMHLADVMGVHCAEAWGDRYTLAMIYLAAHNIEMTPGYGSFGAGETTPLTGQRDGDLQRQYAGQSAGGGFESNEEAFLKTTIYGRRFLALREGVAAIRPFVVLPAPHRALGS